MWKIKEEYIPNDEDLLAIQNIDDFLSRTKYVIDDN